MGINELDWSSPCSRAQYPNIWLEFRAVESKHSMNVVEYRIQDIPEDRIEEAIGFLELYYVPESTLARALGKLSINVKTLKPHRNMQIYFY